MSDFPAEAFRLDGDPGAIRGSAAKYKAFGSDATNAASRIRSLDTSLFIGPEGDTYRDGLKQDLPPHLETTGTAFTMVATALSTFAGDLTALQERMSPLRSQAPALWAAVQHAQTAVSNAHAADSSHASSVAAAKAKLKPNETLPPDTYHSDTGAATASLSSAQAAWNSCLGKAGTVKADLQDAIDKCDKQIHTASGMRFHKNPSGWGALWSGFKGFVKDHVAGLAKLSGVLKTISAVAGVLSFVPGIDVIAAPVALATGAAALAIDASIKVATGQGSWKSIIVDGALLALPGVGKLAKFARTEKVVKEGVDGSRVVVKTENMVVRTRVGIKAGDSEFSQILPKGTKVEVGPGGTAASGTTAPRALAVDRSSRTYAHNGVRVSKSASQNKIAARTVDRLNAAGAKNVRVDQAQMDAAASKVGGNRPDVQGNLNGQQIHVEYDKPGVGGSEGARVAGHRSDILRNDPNSVLVTVPAK